MSVSPLENSPSFSKAFAAFSAAFETAPSALVQTAPSASFQSAPSASFQTTPSASFQTLATSAFVKQHAVLHAISFQLSVHQLVIPSNLNHSVLKHYNLRTWNEVAPRDQAVNPTGQKRYRYFHQKHTCCRVPETQQLFQLHTVFVPPAMDAGWITRIIQVKDGPNVPINMKWAKIRAVPSF